MNQRDRRALQIGGIVLLLAFLGLRVAPLGWTAGTKVWNDFRGRAELLARLRARVEGAETLQDSSLAVKQRLSSLAPALVSGEAESEALATLTEELTGAASRKRVRLMRTTLLADSTRAGELRRLSLRLALEGDTRGTLGFFATLERMPQVLVPVDIRIVAPDPASAATAAEVLQTELTVQAWYLARGRGS